jgi:alkylhydroperoxidase/carboxymuconolactone decarboxylase family protein YurZ
LTSTFAKTDPVFAQMLDATSELAWAIPELTDREKVFLCVVADVCQPALGVPFETHIRHGAGLGVSTADIRALVRVTAYDTGYPAAAEAFQRLAEIEGSDDSAELLDFKKLLAGPNPLPDQVMAQLRELDDHFAGHLELQSRMNAAQGTLTERERAFATMSIDVHYQTLEETFQTHVDRALRAGATHNDVRAALRFNAQFGVTRAWQAWRALNGLLLSRA